MFLWNIFSKKLIKKMLVKLIVGYSRIFMLQCFTVPFLWFQWSSVSPFLPGKAVHQLAENDSPGFYRKEKKRVFIFAKIQTTVFRLQFLNPMQWVSAKKLSWACINNILGVNFINILCAHFSPIFLGQKNEKLNIIRQKLLNSYLYKKNVRVKCWWNWLWMHKIAVGKSRSWVGQKSARKVSRSFWTTSNHIK